MAWTGVATVEKIADALARITGVSLAAGASGTIGLFGSGADIELPRSIHWGPYDSIDLAEAVEVTCTPEIPLSIVKTASPFLVTVTNDQASALGAQAIVGKMSRVNPQTVADGVSTLIDFDTEDFDVGACVDIANNRFDAPVAGKYLVTANVLWALGAFDGPIQFDVLVNGAAQFTAESRLAVDAAGKGALARSQQISTILDLAAGAHVTWQVTQSSGNPYDIAVAEACIQLIAGAAPAATGTLELYLRYH